MKIQTLLIALLFTPVAVAEYPLDFVPDNAIAVLSIKDGNAVNSILKMVNEKSGKPLPSTFSIEVYLSEFFKDPSAIDLTSETIVIIAPTKPAPEVKQIGMFGSMPQMTVICKVKEGRNIETTPSSGLQTTVTIDGWFIATAADQWTPKNTEGPSPIVAFLPDSLIGLTVDFGSLWRQFGSIAQMLGGVGIGSLSKPGPDGVISPETKKAAAVANKAFRELVDICADVQHISMGVDFDNHTVVASVDVEMKEPKNVSIDNSSILEMSSRLPDSMFQYAMSEKLIRKLGKMDLFSLAAYNREPAPSYPSFLTAGFLTALSAVENIVVAYGLNTKNGLTFSVLADVANQEQYLETISESIDEVTEFLIDDFGVELSPAAYGTNTWDISMIGFDDPNSSTAGMPPLEVWNVLFPKPYQLRVGKKGVNRIVTVLGPKFWKPFLYKHPTPLSRVIQNHAEQVDIDYAMSFDARRAAVGFVDVASIADQKEKMYISSYPPAKSSVLFGTTKTGVFIEIKSDLGGIATLTSDMDKAREQVRQKSHGIGALAGQAIGGDTGGTLLGKGVIPLLGGLLEGDKQADE